MFILPRTVLLTAPTSFLLVRKSESTSAVTVNLISHLAAVAMALHPMMAQVLSAGEIIGSVRSFLTDSLRLDLLGQAERNGLWFVRVLLMAATVFDILLLCRGRAKGTRWRTFFSRLYLTVPVLMLTQFVIVLFTIVWGHYEEMQHTLFI